MSQSIFNAFLFGVAFLLAGSFVIVCAAEPPPLSDQIAICTRSCSERGGVFFFSGFGPDVSASGTAQKMRCTCIDDFQSSSGPGPLVKK
ncbi:MAG: hypothetical protein JZU65_23905 [Chlorobium sp.]|nr:hypothetical protein [Chlorobium sp.]